MFKLNPQVVPGMLGTAVPPKLQHARNPRWAALRSEHLKLQRECQACGGTQLLEVHHVLPVHLFPEYEMLESNLVTLCEAGPVCHLHWGHLGCWRRYNARLRDDLGRLRLARGLPPLN